MLQEFLKTNPQFENQLQEAMSQIKVNNFAFNIFKLNDQENYLTISLKINELIQIITTKPSDLFKISDYYHNLNSLFQKTQLAISYYPYYRRISFSNQNNQSKIIIDFQLNHDLTSLLDKDLDLIIKHLHKINTLNINNCFQSNHQLRFYLELNQQWELINASYIDNHRDHVQHYNLNQILLINATDQSKQNKQNRRQYLRNLSNRLLKNS